MRIRISSLAYPTEFLYALREAIGLDLLPSRNSTRNDTIELTQEQFRRVQEVYHQILLDNPPENLAYVSDKGRRLIGESLAGQHTLARMDFYRDWYNRNHYGQRARRIPNWTGDPAGRARHQPDNSNLPPIPEAPLRDTAVQTGPIDRRIPLPPRYRDAVSTIEEELNESLRHYREHREDQARLQVELERVQGLHQESVRNAQRNEAQLREAVGQREREIARLEEQVRFRAGDVVGARRQIERLQEENAEFNERLERGHRENRELQERIARMEEEKERNYEHDVSLIDKRNRERKIANERLLQLGEVLGIPRPVYEDEDLPEVDKEENLRWRVQKVAQRVMEHVRGEGGRTGQAVAAAQEQLRRELEQRHGRERAEGEARLRQQLGEQQREAVRAAQEPLQRELGKRTQDRDFWRNSTDFWQRRIGEHEAERAQLRGQIAGLQEQVAGEGGRTGQAVAAAQERLRQELEQRHERERAEGEARLRQELEEQQREAVRAAQERQRWQMRDEQELAMTATVAPLQRKLSLSARQLQAAQMERRGSHERHEAEGAQLRGQIANLQAQAAGEGERTGQAVVEAQERLRQELEQRHGRERAEGEERLRQELGAQQREAVGQREREIAQLQEQVRNRVGDVEEAQRHIGRLQQENAAFNERLERGHRERREQQGRIAGLEERIAGEGGRTGQAVAEAQERLRQELEQRHGRERAEGEERLRQGHEQELARLREEHAMREGESGQRIQALEEVRARLEDELREAQAGLEVRRGIERRQEEIAQAHAQRNVGVNRTIGNRGRSPWELSSMNEVPYNAYTFGGNIGRNAGGLFEDAMASIYVRNRREANLERGEGEGVPEEEARQMEPPLPAERMAPRWTARRPQRRGASVAPVGVDPNHDAEHALAGQHPVADEPEGYVAPPTPEERVEEHRRAVEAESELESVRPKHSPGGVTTPHRQDVDAFREGQEKVHRIVGAIKKYRYWGERVQEYVKQKRLSLQGEERARLGEVLGDAEFAENYEADTQMRERRENRERMRAIRRRYGEERPSSAAIRERLGQLDQEIREEQRRIRENPEAGVAALQELGEVEYENRAVSAEETRQPVAHVFEWESIPPSTPGGSYTYRRRQGPESDLAAWEGIHRNYEGALEELREMDIPMESYKVGDIELGRPLRLNSEQRHFLQSLPEEHQPEWVSEYQGYQELGDEVGAERLLARYPVVTGERLSERGHRRVEPMGIMPRPVRYEEPNEVRQAVVREHRRRLRRNYQRVA
jgi:DNA repair exonuclease SbcCD ATPase subunit